MLLAPSHSIEGVDDLHRLLDTATVGRALSLSLIRRARLLTVQIVPEPDAP